MTDRHADRTARIVRLLQDAAQMDFSATCAHGRPTGIKLTLEDLERFFHR